MDPLHSFTWIFIVFSFFGTVVLVIRCLGRNQNESVQRGLGDDRSMTPRSSPRAFYPSESPDVVLSWNID
ncbi:MAG: hypothetical protein RBS57_17470 [Desulforhabdus sp.]|jgi:hypothetical protein|nr:hypothetical protein [Desulforhabdus sp.]